MPDELTDPGYQPEYTGDDSLGNVGSGRELGANLYALYRAGRNELPEVASVYAQLTGKIHYMRGSLEAQFDRPQIGRALAHDRLLQLREEAQVILRDNCLRMLEVGRALVETADAYAATDQAAADEFGNLLERNQEDFDNFQIYVPEPPNPNDPIHVPPA
jgi:hypothetical protein